MKRIIFVLMLFLTSVKLFAQSNEVQMADTLRSNGKIYIVVICILIILFGLLIYLFSLDKRLKKLEQKSTAKN